jgi:hypothetical protein
MNDVLRDHLRLRKCAMRARAERRKQEQRSPRRAREPVNGSISRDRGRRSGAIMGTLNADGSSSTADLSVAKESATPISPLDELGGSARGSTDTSQ